MSTGHNNARTIFKPSLPLNSKKRQDFSIDFSSLFPEDSSNDMIMAESYDSEQLLDHFSNFST